MDISKLTKRQREALREFSIYHPRFIVPWKPKTMQSMVDLGLTREAVSSFDRRPHYALTDAGREALAKIIEEDRGGKA